MSESATTALLGPYVGAGRSVEALQEAAKALEEAIQALGYTFTRVVIPRQPLDDGAIELSVVPFTLDTISVQGNKHFGDDQVLASLPGLVPGKTPNTLSLSRSLAVGKLHPSRQQKVTFSASETSRRIDARVEVEDSDPMRYFTWLNNTGNDETGHYRFGVGYQHGNVLGRDHNAALTYTTSPTDANKVDQFGAVYQVPFYASGGMLSVFGAESDIDSGRVADFFDVAGQGTVVGAQYTRFFARKEGLAHRAQFSLTDKLFDNDIGFEGQPVGIDVRSRPLSFRYFGDYVSDRIEADYYVEYVGNLPRGANNDAAAYEASRQGALHNWRLLRYGAGFTRNLPDDWSIMGRLDGQYAHKPLIPGEQIGLGGVNSIRGFQEREVSGDTGVQLRVEVWSPVLGEYSARGVMFFDAGKARLIEAVPGDIASERLASIGAGLNWSWQGRLNARLDAAYVLDGTDPMRSGGSRDGDARVHFNVSYRIK